MHKKTSTLFLMGCLFLFTQSLKAQYLYPYETKVDSIDVVHYEIHADITDFTTQILYANTRVHFKPKVNNINMIDLDLVGLTVDSIKGPGGTLLTATPYTLGYRVNLGTNYNIGDSTWVEFYYHGHPLSDPNFGGFYFTSAFAYAVGIDIDDVPHNNGKTWYPCFDNFVEKATYEFHLKIPMTHNSSANGDLDSITLNPDTTKTEHWSLDYQNSTFVTSACVSTFNKITQDFVSITGDTIPVYFWARPADTTNMINSFVNLEYAFHVLEDAYGPYPYDHIGFSLVPLGGGAMEHTMNIAYPLSLTNGSTTYQSVIFHELAHHWFSNCITPRTVEDLWMKEGFAVYGEYLFDENFYGQAQYDAIVRNTHKQLLWTCHWEDQGYWPLSGIPANLVYGTATYNKSADIVHTLRSYLGDSIFFNGVSDLVAQEMYGVLDAAEFRDVLETTTGVQLDDFFDAWIFQGGWPHISVDSTVATMAGMNYFVDVYLKQKLVGRSNYSAQVPITITFRDNNWNIYEETIISDGANNMVTVTVPFLPTAVYLNGNEKVSHAVTASYRKITATGSSSNTHANMTLNTTSIVDSAFVVIEHNWAAPDPVIDWSKGFTISPQRYWRIDGMWNAGTNFNATMSYNGRTTGSGSRLDDQLITGTEDSLIVLYRPDRANDWDVCTNCTLNTGASTVDKVGTIQVVGLQKGEYALALKGQTIGIEEPNIYNSNIYPNPSSGIFNVECHEPYETLTITNIFGQELMRTNEYTPIMQVNGNFWSKGVYMVNAYNGQQKVFSKRVILQ